MVNPGGPGASAVDTVAGMGAALAGTEITRRFDLVGFDPARRRPLHAGAALPHRRRVRRLPARADGRLQPGGRRAHRGSSTGSSPSAASDRMGRTFLANVGTASAARDMDVVRQALGDEPDQLPRASPTAPSSAPPTSSGSATTCARWCSTAPSTRASDPIDENIHQMAGFQTAFDDYAADCAQFAGLPAGHRSGAVRRPLPPAGRPAGDQARAAPPIRVA